MFLLRLWCQQSFWLALLVSFLKPGGFCLQRGSSIEAAVLFCMEARLITQLVHVYFCKSWLCVFMVWGCVCVCVWNTMTLVMICLSQKNQWWKEVVLVSTAALVDINFSSSCGIWKERGYLFLVCQSVTYNLSASLYQEWWLWMSCTCWETLIEDICWNSSWPKLDMLQRRLWNGGYTEMFVS